MHNIVYCLLTTITQTVYVPYCGGLIIVIDTQVRSSGHGSTEPLSPHCHRTLITNLTHILLIAVTVIIIIFTNLVQVLKLEALQIKNKINQLFETIM